MLAEALPRLVSGMVFKTIEVLLDGRLGGFDSRALPLEDLRDS
jgi:hypothetical protein